jgi:hypothetical protein
MSGIPTPNQPQLADLQAFVQSAAGIPVAYLPLDSPQYQYALNQALAIVNQTLQAVPYQQGSWSTYSLAVLNLATHLILEYAIDQSWLISAASWAAGLVQITTAVPNTIQVGDRVAVSGISPYAYDNAPVDPGSQVPCWTVNSVLDASDFNYPVGDNPGTAILAANATVSECYFQIARARLRLNDFAPGIISSTGDLSTSASLLNQEYMRTLTLENIQLLKTSWGRAYLSIAMKYGTIWGLT